MPRLPSLFDIFDEPPLLAVSRNRRGCSHGPWLKTTTVWPGETFERLTWTCGRCAEVRGRA